MSQPSPRPPGDADKRRVSAPNPLFLKRHSSRLDSGGDLSSLHRARVSLASDDGVTLDDVTLASASGASRASRCGATPAPRIAVAFVVAVMVAAGVAAAILLASVPSSVTVPETFTATFVARSKIGNGTATGTVYKTTARPGSAFQWHVRGVASMEAAGGQQTLTLTVVDDQGVAQLRSSSASPGDGALATFCANAKRTPSLADVATALESAVAVDEEAMVQVVGRGGCEGEGYTRALVQLSRTPAVVCWRAGYTDVQVATTEFVAHVDASLSVDEEAMLAVTLPTQDGSSATVLDCPLGDSSGVIASSRRVQAAAPGRGLGVAAAPGHARRLCVDCCGVTGNNHPPDQEDCCPGTQGCRRRLAPETETPLQQDDAGVPTASQVPGAGLKRQRRLVGPTTCARDVSTHPNVKKCVFVHGMFVRVSGYSSATEVLPDFPEYWGDIKQWVEPYCSSVKFVKFQMKDYSVTAGSSQHALCSALKEANDSLLPLTDTLLFVHGVGNLVLASAQDWFPQCALPAGSYWFEIQSGRHTSVYADWGDHFCTTQDAVQPTQAEADTQADFLDKYPYCRNLPGVRRRLAIGAGELDYAWQSLRTATSSFFTTAASIVQQNVTATMCAVDDNNPASAALYQNILDQPWDLDYTPYPAGNRWSNCWTGNRVFDDDWRAEHYTVEVSHIDTSCKFGNQWYHPSKPDAVKPCSWFQQMACKYGGATPM